MAHWSEIPGYKFGPPEGVAPRVLDQVQQAVPSASEIQPRMSAHFGSSSPGGGGYDSDGQKFRGGIVFSGSSPVINHARTRKNAREAYHMSVPAQAIVKRFVEIVVGDGIKLDPKPAADILGITQQAAEIWARDFRERFDIYARSKQASLKEDMNLYQIQALAEMQARRDGEYFERFHYLRDRDRISTLAIDGIEQSQIVGDAYTNTNSYTSWTHDGIVRDARGRETAYNIRARAADGQVKTIVVPAYRAGRRIMLHGFTPSYANQGRGFSEFHNVLQELSQFTNFSIAHIQKAILQSSIVLSKETVLGGVPSGAPFDLSHTAGIDPPRLTISTETEDGVTTTAASTVPDYRPVDAAINPGGLGIFNNNAGEKLVPFNDTSPSDNFAPFAEAFLSLLCASQNMPYEIFLQKFNANYTAARAALIQVYRYAKTLQGQHESDFLSEVQEAWASEEIAAGRINAPGWQSPLLRRAWLRADWNGPKMPDIDPTKTIKASKDMVEAHISNITREANQITGTDPVENRAINERVLDGSKSAHWNSEKFGPSPGAFSSDNQQGDE